MKGSDTKEVIHDLATAVRGLTDVSSNQEKRLQQLECDLPTELERLRARIEDLPAGRRRELAGQKLAELARLLDCGT